MRHDITRVLGKCNTKLAEATRQSTISIAVDKSDEQLPKMNQLTDLVGQQDL